MNRRKPLIRVLLLVTVILAPSIASAGTPIKHPDVPCCAITGFGPVDGVVAAKETATGRAFQFKVGDPVLLKSLKVGQKIYANFTTRKVSIDGVVPCCNFVPVDGYTPVDGVRGTEQPPAGTGYTPVDGIHGKVNPGQPCCGITSFGPASGVVTARETATGRTFQFKVDDSALLKTLKVGQKIYANFTTQKVSIDGATPCCTFVPVDGYTPVDGVRGTEQQYSAFSKQSLASFSITPDASRHDGKYVLIMLTVTDKARADRSQLPPWFNAMVDNNLVRLVDDGQYPDAEAGDGVYTAAGRLAGDDELAGAITLPLVKGELAHGSKTPYQQKQPKPTSSGQTTCWVETVECPPNCKSSIFQTRCIICLKIKCKIVF